MATSMIDKKLTAVHTSNLLRVEDDVHSWYHNEAETESEKTETDEK